MNVATVTDLSTRRAEALPAEPVEGGPEWTLPPGAVPVDCVTFGEMTRTINRLTKRLDEVEGRLRQFEMHAARKADR